MTTNLHRHTVGENSLPELEEINVLTGNFDGTPLVPQLKWERIVHRIPRGGRHTREGWRQRLPFPHVDLPNNAKENSLSTYIVLLE